MKPTFRLWEFKGGPSEDVREELDSHVQFEVEALMDEGLSEEEARAVAEKKLGSRERIESEATRYAARLSRRRRLGGQLDTLRQDVGYGLRTLRRAPAATTLTILLLALGVGANTALFSMLKGVVLEPLNLPDAHELVFLWERDDQSPNLLSSYANYQDWRESSRTIRTMGAYLSRHVNLTGGAESVRVRGALTTSSLFTVFGVPPHLGRPLLSDEEFSGAQVAVLDHSTWQTRYGGDPDIIGKDIGLDGAPHQVVGVMPRGFQQPDPTSLEPIHVWVPLPSGTEYEPRGIHSYQVLGRLAPGAALPGAREELDRTAQRLAEEYPESNRGIGVRIEPVHQVLFGEAEKQILLVMGAALLVLLIACGNIASLQLARSAMRSGEMAVRGALGGSRWRVIRQLLTENGILAVGGGLAGILVAWWTLGLLRGFAPPDLPRVETIGLDGAALLFSVTVAMVLGGLFGLAPAMRAARVPVSSVLKEEHGREGGVSHGARLQSSFIVGQFAFGLVICNAAFLLVQSLGALKGNELGFRTTDVLTMEISLRGDGYSIVRGRAEFYDELFPRLQGLAGVEEVGATSSLPLGVGGETSAIREEDWGMDQAGAAVKLRTDRVAGAYFSTMGVPLLDGRFFARGEDDARLGDSKAILNQAAASALWPEEDPLGKRFSYPGEEPRWIEIVGVVANSRNGGLGLDPIPEIFFPFASLPPGRMFLTLRTPADPLALAPLVLEEIRSVDPLQAVSQVQTMEEVVGSLLSRREFYTTLITVLAGLAFLLAGAGIYGGVSQYVAGRRRELGIRVALGCEKMDLFGLILGRTVVLAGTGLGLGAVGVFLSRSLVRGYLYGVGSMDPSALGAGMATLLLVAILAAIPPARRASNADPVQSLGSG